MASGPEGLRPGGIKIKDPKSTSTIWIFIETHKKQCLWYANTFYQSHQNKRIMLILICVTNLSMLMIKLTVINYFLHEPNSGKARSDATLAQTGHFKMR